MLSDCIQFERFGDSRLDRPAFTITGAQDGCGGLSGAVADKIPVFSPGLKRAVEIC